MSDDKTNEATWQELEKEIVLIELLVQRLPEDRRAQAAFRIAVAAANWGSRNSLEAIGILEEAKLSYREERDKILSRWEEEEEG